MHGEHGDVLKDKRNASPAASLERKVQLYENGPPGVGWRNALNRGLVDQCANDGLTPEVHHHRPANKALAADQEPVPATCGAA